MIAVALQKFLCQLARQSFGEELCKGESWLLLPSLAWQDIIDKLDSISALPAIFGKSLLEQQGNAIWYAFCLLLGDNFAYVV